MKYIKNISIFIMILLMLTTIFSGCGDDSPSNNNSKENEIISTYQAIDAVKDHFWTNQEIASTLGFKQFYDPDYGICNASKNSDSSWDVTLKGHMSGYIDEYQSDFETYKFRVEATIDINGKLIDLYVYKEY